MAAAACALLVPGSVLVVPPASAQEPWSVAAATMRFKVEVVSRPSSADAGVIVTIPNGGVLPGASPYAVVIDSAGRPVPSECIWNNPQEGYALVFAMAPGPLWIYFEGASDSSHASALGSPLHPSLLLYTRAGHASLEDARALAGEDPPGAGIRMGQVPMIADSQNRFGASDNFTSYYTGWLNVPQSGEVFIGTISEDGSTVLIDGRTAADWPGIHSFKEGRTGTKGNTIMLTAGEHRVQYLKFTSEGPPMAQLIWRLPSMGRAELPRTPRGTDFVRSGGAVVIGAESRSGAPPALFNRRVLSYMNFGNEFIDLYELSVPLAGQYKGASLAWRFSDGSQARGADILWPLIRGTPASATLTVTSSNAASSATRPLYLDTLPQGARVEDVFARRGYTQALLNRLEGAPAGASPAAGWPPAFWEMLPQIVQAGESKDLLAYLFQHCSADLGNLSPDDRQRMGDIFYDEIKGDKAAAPGILSNIIAAQKTPGAQFHWELKAIDFDLFETNNMAAARQLAAGLRVDPFQGGKDDAELRLIAMGDVERMAGNIDAATQDYTAAQAVNQQAARAPFQAFAGFNNEMPSSQPAPARSGNGIVIGAATSQDADWRKRAVLQNSYYTEVKNLLDHYDMDDARAKLDAWAIEFPLDKLGGDYTLAEAEFALKFYDYDRAQRILKAYRIRTDLSAQLAEAMQMEWDCDTKLRRPADTKELAADIKKRFPDLPLAREAESALTQ